MNSSDSAKNPIVETTAGAVQGFWRRGSAAFLGIPYAEPPFGERRFLAPEMKAPWRGVYDALAYGATPQRKALSEVTAIPEPSVPGEDILSVNVFTPQPREPLVGERGLPVLVYIHGGGYVAGSPASPWYDGAAFNRDGVIVVTVAYRLGFEGFGWLPDAPLNRGMLDWLLALRWVRDNIAGFGGDPSRVTIAGQSAGGGAVMSLLVSPAARGLFAGAIAMSAVPADIPLAAAERTTISLAARLGVDSDRTGFASVSEMDVLKAIDTKFPVFEHRSAEGLIEASRGMGAAIGFGPVLDGTLCPGSVEEGLQKGRGADVPLMIGYTRDEFSGLAVSNRELFDGWQVEELLRKIGLDDATAGAYAAALPESDAAEVLGQYTTDLLFRRYFSLWSSARGGRTWGYDFAWKGVDGVAGHCLDVPFAFDVPTDEHVIRLAGPYPPRSLARAVHGAYVRFVRDGAPGWRPYAESGEVMVWGDQSEIGQRRYDSAQVLSEVGGGAS